MIIAESGLLPAKWADVQVVVPQVRPRRHLAKAARSRGAGREAWFMGGNKDGGRPVGVAQRHEPRTGRRSEAEGLLPGALRSDYIHSLHHGHRKQVPRGYAPTRRDTARAGSASNDSLEKALFFA